MRAFAWVMLVSMLCADVAGAQTLRERLAERRAVHQNRVTDVAYGSDPAQVFDVYRPANAQRAPIIVMVHGGGWRRGDKGSSTVVENKVRHWNQLGYLVVSTNYRMLPTPVLQQADDVALAVKTVQARAAEWGGDPAHIALVGHSAGAHLVSLLNARGPGPWQAVVALDSAAFDVEAIMQGRHLPLYDKAFGSDPAVWRAVSPLAQLSAAARPTLAVCSSQRNDSCPQAERFAVKARSMGLPVEVLPVALSHREINDALGEPSAYTRSVDEFLSKFR